MALADTVLPPRHASVEWPTLGLMILVYLAWLALTFFHASLPLWILVPLGAWAVAWQSSLQHEALHGHPTRHRWLNTALATPPLSLWVPYQRYRALHLAHHRDERLTDPMDDPESYYWAPDDWAGLGAFGRWLVALQSTLFGRLVIGPIWSLYRFWLTEARAIRSGDRVIAKVWAWHAVHVALVLAWVVLVCGMPVWEYLAIFVYGGTALILIRSFAEHRAASEVERRTAVVEGSTVFALLFLNNNLHFVHHTWPSVAWYRLPSLYRATRDEVLRANGGLVYDGYSDVFRRFFLSRHDQATHPLGRAPMRDGSSAAAPQAGNA